MKKDSPCFTVAQSPDAWQVFEKRAVERSTTVNECRSFEDYSWSNEALHQIESYGHHQRLNIALALQLARTWFLKTRSIGKLIVLITFDFIVFRHFRGLHLKWSFNCSAKNRASYFENALGR
jgi:hypothetical protein